MHHDDTTHRRLGAAVIALMLAGFAALANAPAVATGTVADTAHAESALRMLDRTVVHHPSSPAAVAAKQAASVPPPKGPDAVRTVRPNLDNVALHGTLPSGKGMWIWLPDYVEAGNPRAIVARARRVGLTHVYVRTGSSKMGFYAQDFLDALLPVAHAAGIRVYGWDFPYLGRVTDDVNRSLAAIAHTTPGGHRIDGFVPDIETPAEGTKLSAERAGRFSRDLRRAVGSDYPLVAAVPRPSAQRIADYPYREILRHMDAVAPMVYWLNRQPDTDVAGAMRWLGRFDIPVMPIGQAYDGAPEGGRPGVPPPDELNRFMATAAAHGATTVSFWSWQHADRKAWATIRDFPGFITPTLPAVPAVTSLIP